MFWRADEISCVVGMLLLLGPIQSVFPKFPIFEDAKKTLEYQIESMDRWKGDDFAVVSAPLACDSRKRADVETKDPVVSARKVQKADREKLRRDRLNEHFHELGNTLDPDRPKNDKGTILTDTIQMLKDLTSDVNKLKAECAALNDESLELTVEKNELREEKASLKSDIENLNAQYQQRDRVIFPWGAMDPSVVMAPPYSYPMPVAVPPGSIPVHPSLQPFPYYQAQNPATVPNPCPTFVSYPTPINAPVEQLLPQPQYASVSLVSSKQDSKSKSSDHQRGSNAERCNDSNDVATDLVLKMPGTSANQESSSGARKGKQSQRKDKSITDGSSSSRYSSSQVFQESSSNSVGAIPKTNK